MKTICATIPHLAWKFLIICIVFAQPMDVSAGEECEDYKAVSVEGMNALASEAEYLATRNTLLNQLLVDAVTQVNGAMVRSVESTHLSVMNDKVDDRYDLLNVKRAKGLVRSYTFAVDGETIEKTTLGKMLKLKLDVVVCAQPGGEDVVYIALGDIAFPEYSEFSDRYLSEFVRSAIPAGSKLRLIERERDVGYYDYVVTGKVLNISATAEDSVLKALIGNVVRTGDGQPIVDSTEYRLSATIALKAENPVNKTYTVVTDTVEKRLGAGVRRDGALAQRLDEFAGEAVGAASAQLFEKIIHQEGFKPAFRRD